jgi:hypothetical protein
VSNRYQNKQKQNKNKETKQKQKNKKQKNPNKQKRREKSHAHACYIVTSEGGTSKTVFFSSPELKAQVSYSDRPLSVRLSTFSTSSPEPLGQF